MAASANETMMSQVSEWRLLLLLPPPLHRIALPAETKISCLESCEYLRFVLVKTFTNCKAVAAVAAAAAAVVAVASAHAASVARRICK